MIAFDLQSHSLHSDGDLPAPEVVRLAAAAGIELLALSDHDTVDGTDEALAAGLEHGVRIVPAAEISAVDGAFEDLHVLGYGIDHTDAQLLARLEDAREDRGRRADRMAAKLEELGWQVDHAALDARRDAGKPIGRPHLSAAVLSHPDNATRLEAEGYAGELTKFLVDHLIPGAPAYLARERPTVVEAIGWIHDAGGVAVWAHPFWDIDHPETVVEALERYVAAGLDGVEVFYPTHDAAQAALLFGQCTRLGLLTTGSADFHGPDHKLFSRFGAFELHGLQPRLGSLTG